MIYDHRVKIGGIWLEAGVEYSTPFSKANVNPPKKDTESQYTRTDIQKMKVEELQKVANEPGIEADENATGT